VTNRRLRRLAKGVVLLAALAVGGACAERSNVDPEAAVVVRGRALDVDSSPLAARPVRLGSGVTTLEGGAGALTAGLFCLSGECTGDFFDDTTAADGSFTLELTGRDTQSAFGEATSFLLSTSAPPVGDHPAGPALSARFRIQTTEVALPALQLVDPAFHLAGADGAVDAVWDGAVAPGPYTVRFADRDGGTVWEETAAEPAIRIDGRVLEDTAGQVAVGGSRQDQIEGSDVTITWRSSSAAFRGGYGPPPSRGAGCELRAADGTVQALGDCGLTDGSFAAAGLPSTVCPSGPAATAPSGCAPVVAVRVLLPRPEPADLVVVRGGAEGDHLTAVHEAGPTDAGAVRAPFGTAGLDGTPVVAVEVTTADITALAEVSVWSPVPDLPSPLLPIDDPSAVGSAGAEDGGGRALAAGAAGALLLLAGVLLGVTLVRRSRPPAGRIVS
jgi:hypothetical protein